MRSLAQSEGSDTASPLTLSPSHPRSVVLAHTASSPSCGTLRAAPSSGGSLGGVPGVTCGLVHRHGARCGWPPLYTCLTPDVLVRQGRLVVQACVRLVYSVPAHTISLVRPPLPLSLSPLLDYAHVALLSLTFLTLFPTRWPTVMDHASLRLCVGHLVRSSR